MSTVPQPSKGVVAWGGSPTVPVPGQPGALAAIAGGGGRAP
jgi:hypothetical protein